MNAIWWFIVVVLFIVGGIGISVSWGQDPSVHSLQSESSKHPATGAERLRDFEAVMDRYYRGNSLEKAETALNQAIDQYNRWAKSTEAQHEIARTTLEKEFASLGEIRPQIEEVEKRLAQRPDAHNRAAIEQRNRLVRKYNEAGNIYKKHESAFNESIKQSQREMQERSKKIDADKSAHEKRLAAYQRWANNRGDTKFFKELNGFYGQLRARRALGKTPELTQMIDRVAAMRRELGLYAVKRETEATTGLVIVEATLCGREKCFMVVDTGATAVTISPSLVGVLGLSGQLGKNVSANLADGRQTTGRELVIPKLSVLGREVRDVKAIALDEPGVGIDGLLGLSYLNHFDFHLDQRDPNKLILKPKSEH
jgi:hypothetical protein